MEVKYLCHGCKKQGKAGISSFLVVAYSGKLNKLMYTSLCEECFSSGTNLRKVLCVLSGKKGIVEFINYKSVSGLKKVNSSVYEEFKQFLAMYGIKI